MPRKPRQQRSRATVDAIIEAGFICVARHGVANTTTRHIADVAGIGVGSLYEYFANKEDIFDAMNKRFVDDVVQLIRDITPHMLALDIEPAIELVFRHFGEFLTRDDERYLKVARQIVQADTKDYVEPVSKALMDMLMRYIVSHAELMRLPDIPTMAYIIINGGIFTVLRHLSSEDPPISYAQLSRGLASMVNSWVQQNLPPPARGAAGKRRRNG